MTDQAYDVIEKERALSKAVKRAAEFLQLGNNDMSEILDLPEDELMGVFNEIANIKYDSPAFKNAVSFIGLYSSLYACAGGKSEIAVHWLQAANSYFSHEKPINVIKKQGGLDHARNYLDHMMCFP